MEREKAKRGNLRIAILLALFLCAVNWNIFSISGEAAESGTVIFTETVTDVTTGIRVYSERGTWLFVESGNQLVAKKQSTRDGVRTIKISPQKAGSKLKIVSLQSKKRNIIKKWTVKKISPQKESKKIKKPTVITKIIKSTDTRIKVKGCKGSKLYIKDDDNKLLKTVNYKKDEVKSVKLPKQKNTDNLYFYLVRGNRRSAVVKKEVKDVTAPLKPVVREKSSGSLLVKGELGSTVYVKYGSKSVYVSKGIIADKNGKMISGQKPDDKGFYYVMLKDISGNTSPIAKVKSKYYKPGGGDVKPEPEYSYKITPILMPFNRYFYVETDDPDPSDIIFVDKSSIYFPYENLDFDQCPWIEPVRYCYMDVAYEDKSAARVKGGYIFKLMNNDYFDGGELTLCRIEGEDIKETKTTVSCVPVKGTAQYLIDTYTSPDREFFDNMSAVQEALDELALYPKSLEDIDRKTSESYPLLYTSPYKEIGLGRGYFMYERAEEPLFLNSVYPYILDSARFPSLIAEIARKLAPDCQIESLAGYGLHEMMEITKDGETRYFGGAGSGGSDPIYSNHVQKLFLFDGSKEDYAENATIDQLFQKRMEYGEYSQEELAYYKDLVEGDTYSQTIGMGSWIRVASGSLFGISGTDYTYVSHGNVYKEGSGNRPAGVKNIWVDGRYIDSYGRFVQGVKFADYPEARIMLRDMSYMNKQGEECRGDVSYQYDEASGCWLSKAYGWDSNFTIKDLPDEMILTPEEVEALEIDRNTDVIPSGLIYDGTAFPGTPY